ncbi:MAG: BREX system ATP-binding domain-containing protein [candidate division WOR-3 bacterium]
MVKDRQVFHPVFGKGILLSVRKSPIRLQTECFVSFESGLKLWIPAYRLSGVDKELTQGIVKDGRVLKEEELKIKAHRMIEAFRLGIVPAEDVSDFTFGREVETKVIQKLLNNLKEGSGGAILIEGSYGAGKSHFLEYIKSEALKQKALVSSVVLSTQETTPARPKRVYRDIIANLRYRKDNFLKPPSSGIFLETIEGGFRDLLFSAAKNYRAPDFLDMKEHIFWAPVLKQLQRIEEDSYKAEVFWQWIEGESTKEYAVGRYVHNKRIVMPYRISGGWRIPALYDFSTAIDFYCYLISGLSYLARKLNYSGLVLLMDEVETIAFHGNSFYYERGTAFLDGLIKMAQNSPALKSFNTQLIHNQVRPTPYIYKDSYVLLVLASTPEPATMRFKSMVNAHIELEPLTAEHLSSCFEALLEYYKIAFPNVEILSTTKRQILENALKYHKAGVRYFLKYVVESLDTIRINRTFKFA